MFVVYKPPTLWYFVIAVQTDSDACGVCLPGMSRSLHLGVCSRNRFLNEAAFHASKPGPQGPSERTHPSVQVLAKSPRLFNLVNFEYHVMEKWEGAAPRTVVSTFGQG